MNTIETKNRSSISKMGWSILIGICILLVLNSLMLYFFIAPSTGEQTTSILLGGFGILALAVSLEGFRFRSRWAWNAAWVLVGVLALTGVHITFFGELYVGFFYLSLAAVTLVAQFLSKPGLEVSHPSSGGHK